MLSNTLCNHLGLVVLRPLFRRSPSPPSSTTSSSMAKTSEILVVTPEDAGVKSSMDGNGNMMRTDKNTDASGIVGKDRVRAKFVWFVW